MFVICNVTPVWWAESARMRDPDHSHQSSGCFPSHLIKPKTQMGYRLQGWKEKITVYFLPILLLNESFFSFAWNIFNSPIQDSTTSAFQLNCRKAEFSSSLAFLWAAALSSSDTFPRRALILAMMFSTLWFSCKKETKWQWYCYQLTLNFIETCLWLSI